MQDLNLRPVGLRVPKLSALFCFKDGRLVGDAGFKAATRGIKNTQTWCAYLTLGRMVGDAGFEPATPWTQTKCATKLRQSPTI
jgi:hypothetical protein